MIAAGHTETAAGSSRSTNHHTTQQNQTTPDRPTTGKAARRAKHANTTTNHAHHTGQTKQQEGAGERPATLRGSPQASRAAAGPGRGGGGRGKKKKAGTRECNPRTEWPGGPRDSSAQAPPLRDCRTETTETGACSGHAMKGACPSGLASTAGAAHQERGVRREAGQRECTRRQETDQTRPDQTRQKKSGAEAQAGITGSRRVGSDAIRSSDSATRSPQRGRRRQKRTEGEGERKKRQER